MTPSDWAVVGGLLFLATCATLDRPSWDDGYVPTGEISSQEPKKVLDFGGEIEYTEDTIRNQE